MNLLQVTGLSKEVGNDFVLKEVSFSQQAFQKIAIAGETGSGKSTLLKVIAGLAQPQSGEVLLNDERVLGPDERLIAGHQQIAYLSQHFELRNNYRVEELLEMANKIPEEEASLIFEICQVKHLLKRRSDQLSGGEKQRIASARLLVTAPQLLLLDEPYSNLDMVHKKVLKSVIHDISEKLKITCILVSHDPVDTLSWADEIIVMKAGEIIQKGTPLQIYRQPVNEYVAGLFGNYNLIDGPVAANFPALLACSNGKTAFARPEDFEIVQGEEGAVIGEVSRVSFFGGYYEVEVICDESLLIVRSTNCELVKGDLVYVASR
ncbi:MAG: ABC transporter ATP-binding protein [Bacteroidota bacterium]|nr:ABC transporter ATP-binding protein [Bacteroidota bacterium]